MTVRAGPDPDEVVEEQAPVDQGSGPARQREGSDGARGESRQPLDVGRTDDLCAVGARRRRDLAPVGTPVAGDQNRHRPPVTVEDQGLDDLVEVRPERGRGFVGGGGRRLELFDAGFGAAQLQERGDPLDRFGPGGTQPSAASTCASERSTSALFAALYA